MPPVNVPAGGRAAHGVLTPAAIEVITFDRDLDRVEVLTDSTAEVWATTDGTDPAANGARSIRLPAGGGWNGTTLDVLEGGPSVIKLLAPAGTPKYSVTEAR